MCRLPRTFTMTSDWPSAVGGVLVAWPEALVDPESRQSAAAGTATGPSSPQCARPASVHIASHSHTRGTVTTAKVTLLAQWRPRGVCRPPPADAWHAACLGLCRRRFDVHLINITR